MEPRIGHQLDELEPRFTLSLPGILQRPRLTQKHSLTGMLFALRQFKKANANC